VGSGAGVEVDVCVGTGVAVALATGEGVQESIKGGVREGANTSAPISSGDGVSATCCQPKINTNAIAKTSHHLRFAIRLKSMYTETSIVCFSHAFYHEMSSKASF